MGASQSALPAFDAEAYIPPERAALDPAVRAKLPGPGVHTLVSYLPLRMYRSYYDGEGAKDNPALKVPVTEENLTLSSADPSHLLRCRLYHPQALADSKAASPLVLFIHGGGFCMGSLESHQSSCRFIAAETGFRVLAITYRRAPEFKYPAADQDTVALYKQICASPARFGLDAAAPSVIVTGDSAGAQLSISLCLRIRDHNRSPTSVATPADDAAVTAGAGSPSAPALIQPSLLAPLYPGINRFTLQPSNFKYYTNYVLTVPMVEGFFNSYIGEGPAARERLRDDPFLSLDLQKDLSGLPPVVLVTSEFDILHDEGVAFVQALRERGASDVAHIEAKGLLHGFVTNLQAYPTGAAVVRDVCARMVAAAATSAVGAIGGAVAETAEGPAVSAGATIEATAAATTTA